MDMVAARTGLPGSDVTSHVNISMPTETANIRVVARMDSAHLHRGH